MVIVVAAIKRAVIDILRVHEPTTVLIEVLV